MSKHTPGPWVFTSDLKKSGIARIMPGYRQRYCIATIPAGKDVDAKEADARLIAAAPELLEALRQFADMDMRVHPNFSDQVLRARKAIAKATGGAA